MKHRRHSTNGTPGAIAAALAELQSERRAAGARLDALDLAIDNLQRAYGLNGHAGTPVDHKPRRPRAPAADDGAAGERRAVLLKLIEKSDVGLTIGELKKQTPKMAGADRSNALYQLKVAGNIQRAGNAWKAASS